MDNTSETTGPTLNEKKSFDVSWQTVDERDEIGLTSEEDTDEEGPIDEDDGEDDLPTHAMIVAEEGKGVIVRGDDTPIVQLQVSSGVFTFPLFAATILTHRRRHNPSTHRIVNHTECCSFFPHQLASTYHDHSSRS